MAAPVIINPYNSENVLSGFIDDEISAKIRISDSPTSVGVTGNWIGWSHRWNPDRAEVEIFITPTRTFRDSEGIRIVAINDDGQHEQYIPYQFINRPPIISDISPKNFGKGLSISYDIMIKNNPSVVSVRGDLIGLKHSTISGGVRISGDIPSDELLKTSGTYTVTASNGSGTAPEKIGAWKILERPSKPLSVSGSSTPQGVITLSWDPPADNAGFEIVDYEWGFASDVDPFLVLVWSSVGSVATTYTLGEPIFAGVWGLRIRAINSEEVPSYSSDLVQVQVYDVPQQPEQFYDEIRIFTALFTWTYWTGAPDLLVFPVIRTEYKLSGTEHWIRTSGSPSTLNIGWVEGTINLTGLSPNTEYALQIRNVNAVGNGHTLTIPFLTHEVPNPEPPLTYDYTTTATSFSFRWFYGRPDFLDLYELPITRTEYRILDLDDIVLEDWVSVRGTYNSDTGQVEGLVTIRDLEPDTSYWVEIRNQNSHRIGDPAIIFVATDFE